MRGRLPQPVLNWSAEKAAIDVNVAGFATLASTAFRHFEQVRAGHLVGISSIVALRGSRHAPAYKCIEGICIELPGRTSIPGNERGAADCGDRYPAGICGYGDGEGGGAVLGGLAAQGGEANLSGHREEGEARLRHTTMFAWVFGPLPDFILARM